MLDAGGMHPSFGFENRATLVAELCKRWPVSLRPAVGGGGAVQTFDRTALISSEAAAVLMCAGGAKGVGLFWGQNRSDRAPFAL